MTDIVIKYEAPDEAKMRVIDLKVGDFFIHRGTVYVKTKHTDYNTGYRVPAFNFKYKILNLIEEKTKVTFLPGVNIVVPLASVREKAVTKK